MLRPGEFACPAAARAFTTELAWAGSPHCPRRLSLDGLIVIYHHRTFTGWTGSRMGCKQRTQRRKKTGYSETDGGKKRSAERRLWVPVGIGGVCDPVGLRQI